MDEIERLDSDEFKDSNLDDDNEDLYKDFSNTREFHVLDELDASVNDEDENKTNRDSDSSSGNEAYSEDDDGDESDIHEDEIDAMLEAGSTVI